MSSSSFFVRWRDLAVLVACLGFQIVYRPAVVSGQAIVQDSRILTVPVGYEEVLSRLDGEDASREMFASQDVTLTEYKLRKSDQSTNDKQEEGVTRAKIDIVGYSCEFGSMCFLSSVVATEKQTVIDVELVRPVGMLRNQHYRYLIVPQGEDSTTITISHELDVVLMKRKLNLVNRIISEVTYKKACEELLKLSSKMVDSVNCIVNRQKPKTESSQNESESADGNDMEEAVDEDSENEPSNDSPQSQAKPDPSPSDLQSAPEASIASKTESPSNSVAEPDKKAEVSSPITSPITSTIPENIEQLADSAKSLPAVPSQSNENPTQSTNTTATEKVEAPKSAVDDSNVSKEIANSASVQETESQPKSPVLRVVIDGVATTSGSMRIALFKTIEEFKAFDARKDEASQGEAFKKVVVRIKKSGRLAYEFKDVPMGSYVIAAFHDQDNNKKLNSSFIGLPSEPYGFSRDARGSFGAPSFADAEIKFDEKNNSFNFKIK